jgi:hypothetical protein
MSAFDLMYDVTEQTTTRYVGFLGQHGRYDLAILTTNHFYGKKLVTLLTNNRSAILNQQDLEHVGFLQEVFQLKTIEEAEELANFLSSNL